MGRVQEGWTKRAGRLDAWLSASGGDGGRAVRTGAADGVVIEDLGVPGNPRYELSRNDLTGENVGMLNFCGRLLASETFTSLEARVSEPSVLHITTTNLDRVEISVDDRPHPITEELPELDVDLPNEWYGVEVRGFKGSTLRQRRLVRR